MLGKSWYFSCEGEVEGPFELKQVRVKIKQHPEGLVWSPALTHWQPALKVFSRNDSQKVVPPKLNQTPELTTKIDAQRLLVERKAGENYNKLLMAKGMKDLAKKWLLLERKHTREKNALFQHFMKAQSAQLNAAKTELKKLQQQQAKLLEQKSLKNNTVIASKANPAKTTSKTAAAKTKVIPKIRSPKVATARAGDTPTQQMLHIGEQRKAPKEAEEFMDQQLSPEAIVKARIARAKADMQAQVDEKNTMNQTKKGEVYPWPKTQPKKRVAANNSIQKKSKKVSEALLMAKKQPIEMVRKMVLSQMNKG